MKCTNCGIELEEGSKYCYKCGEKVEENWIDDVQASLDEMEEGISDNSKKNRFIAIVIIIAVLVILLIICIIVGVGSKKKTVYVDDSKITKEDNSDVDPSPELKQSEKMDDIGIADDINGLASEKKEEYNWEKYKTLEKNNKNLDDIIKRYAEVLVEYQGCEYILEDVDGDDMPELLISDRKKPTSTSRIHYFKDLDIEGVIPGTAVYPIKNRNRYIVSIPSGSLYLIWFDPLQQKYVCQYITDEIKEILYRTEDIKIDGLTEKPMCGTQEYEPFEKIGYRIVIHNQVVEQDSNSEYGTFEGTVELYQGDGEIDPVVGGVDYSYYLIRFDSVQKLNVAYYDEGKEIVEYELDYIPLATGTYDWGSYVGKRVKLVGNVSDGPMRYDYSLYVEKAEIIGDSVSSTNKSLDTNFEKKADDQIADINQNDEYAVYKDILRSYMNDEFGIGGLYDARKYSEGAGRFALLDVNNDGVKELLLSNDFNWFVYTNDLVMDGNYDGDYLTFELIGYDGASNECIIMQQELGEPTVRRMYIGREIAYETEINESEVSSYMEAYKISVPSYEVNAENIETYLK